jgi:4-amino-4-deoxy-L-arabinose transferase-like glycosyltransferase
MSLTPGTHWQASFVLIITSLLLFLPGFFALPATDRDESRFAQATKQMVAGGDYVNIRFQNEARNKKPIGIYWLQAAAVRLSGFGEGAPIWVYRLPSLLGAIAAVLLTYWALLAVLTREEAFYAALLLSACVLLGAEARLAKTDAVLLATVTAAMGALLRLFLEREKSKLYNAFIFWIALALGTLIKGPVILLVTGASALAFSFYRKSGAWLKQLRSLYGLLLYALLVLPWFIAIFYATGGAFFHDSVGRDMFAKVVSGQEMHGAPPGTYFGLLWFTFFPSACFLAACIPYLWKHWRQKKIILLFLWILPAWFVFELIPTKLPHYVLPLYPALAGLTAHALSAQDWKMTASWQRFCMSALIIVPPILLLMALFLLRAVEGKIDWLVLALVPLVTVVGYCAFQESRIDSRRAITFMIAGSILLYFGVVGRVLPNLSEFWLSPRIVEAVKANTTCENPQLVSAGYHEPSLVFLTSKDILLTDTKDAADFLLQKTCRIALIDEEPELKAFEQRLREKGARAKRLALVEGRNVNGAQKREIGLWVLDLSR